MRSIAFAPFILLASISITLACGTERWPVKTGTDTTVDRVALQPEATTIEDLSAINAPQHPNARKKSRFPIEFKTFQISGILTLIKKEEDEDYHLVITDPSDDDPTMIVESPHPNCAAGSRFLSQITNVRRDLDQKFGNFRREEPNIRVTVTGVAFFDPPHGEGAASNGIELHPILAIEFR